MNSILDAMEGGKLRQALRIQGGINVTPAIMDGV